MSFDLPTLLTQMLERKQRKELVERTGFTSAQVTTMCDGHLPFSNRGGRRSARDDDRYRRLAEWLELPDVEAFVEWVDEQQRLRKADAVSSPSRRVSMSQEGDLLTIEFSARIQGTFSWEIGGKKITLVIE